MSAYLRHILSYQSTIPSEGVLPLHHRPPSCISQKNRGRHINSSQALATILFFFLSTGTTTRTVHRPSSSSHSTLTASNKQHQSITGSTRNHASTIANSNQPAKVQSSTNSRVITQAIPSRYVQQNLLPLPPKANNLKKKNSQAG